MNDGPPAEVVSALKDEDDMSDAKREIYECHDCYGNDEDCDRCFGTNRVCSLCEHGACGAHQVKTRNSSEPGADGRLPYCWSEVCTAPEIEAREAERDAKEAEFQNKRRERLNTRREALYFARDVLQDRRGEMAIDADEHTLVRYDDTIATFDAWLEELTR